MGTVTVMLAGKCHICLIKSLLVLKKDIKIYALDPIITQLFHFFHSQEIPEKVPFTSGYRNIEEGVR